MFTLLAVILFWVVPTIVGLKLSERKGRGTAIGALLGFLLGWIGVIIVLVLSDKNAERNDDAERESMQQLKYRECPSCKEPMRRDASVCPHCRAESQAWQFNDGHWWSRSSDGNWYWLDEQVSAWRQLPTTEHLSSVSTSATGGTSTAGRPTVTTPDSEEGGT